VEFAFFSPFLSAKNCLTIYGVAQMNLLTDVTFIEVALSLVTVGVIERLAVQYLPETMVGPEGWLLTTSE
jgi:hypothetical protein